jgi:hypothetical protein
MVLTSNANRILKWKPLGKIPLGKVRRLEDNTRCVYVYIHTPISIHIYMSTEF